MQLVRSVEAVRPSGRKFLVIAALLDGKSTLAKENKYSTHPVMKAASNGRKECPHAEVAVLKDIRDKSIRGPMLVLRENRQGQLVLAKPCKFCHHYIVTNFPKLEVFYSADNGEILRLRRNETFSEVENEEDL
jgi:hypothetical protein